MKASFPIDILDSTLCPVKSVKNLGVILIFPNPNMSNMSAIVVLQLRDFRPVKRLFTHDASVLVVSALVSSRLDYCNSLFRTLSKFNLRKFQCIQNSAARIVSNTNRYTSITPLLRNCIDFLLNITVFKTATLVHIQVSSDWFS